MSTDPFEPAVNAHSCALACLVSLCRDFGDPVSQQALIEHHKDDIDAWAERPGALTPYQFISLSRAYLGTKAHIWVEYREWILKYWNQPERIGGVIVSQCQPVENGGRMTIDHCWRILEASKDGMRLMNPRVGKAELALVDWGFLTERKAYALIIGR